MGSREITFHIYTEKESVKPQLSKIEHFGNFNRKGNDYVEFYTYAKVKNFTL